MRTADVFMLSFFSFVFLFSAKGIYDAAVKLQANRCTMTYMYEFPQYIKIPLEKNVEKAFKDYSLFCYGEGKVASNIREGKFFGIPVLFLPGNAGSHEQARSLASVALRKAIDEGRRFHFDFFTISFAEEYSAIYGGVLEKQSKFLEHAIDEILSLYDGKGRPSSVLVIGHSMGGVIARSIFTNGGFDPSKVQTVITLATPHVDPVITTDYALRRFYDRIGRHWHSHAANLDFLVMASIGGGLRDFQVRSGLTSLKSDGLSVLTTAMPRVWLETDHLCIVWCKEVVLAVVRSLFDMVDPSSRQFYRDAARRREVLEYHLVKRNGGKSINDRPFPREVEFRQNATWREVIRRQMTITPPTTGTEYYMFQAVENPRFNLLTAVGHFWDIEDWVFACFPNEFKDNVRYCSSGKSLTFMTSLLPHSAKELRIDLSQVRKDGYTHVVFVAPSKLGKKAWLDIDIHSENQRHHKMALPSPISINPFKPIATFNIEKGVVPYRYSLEGLQEAWQSYEVEIHPDCDDEAKRAGFVKFSVPWSSEGYVDAIRKNVSKSMTLQLYVPKPKDAPDQEVPELQLILSPQCSFAVDIKVNYSGIFAQLLRFYATLLPGVCVAVVLEVLRLQLDKVNELPSFFTTIMKVSLLRLIIIPKAVGLLLGFISSWQVRTTFTVPPDEVRLEDKDLGLLYLFPYLVIVGSVLCFLLAVIARVIVFVCGNTMHHAVIRFFVRRTIQSEAVVDFAVDKVTKFPFVVSAALISVAYGGCGTLALSCGFLFHFIKLFKIYSSLLENQVKGITYKVLGVGRIAKQEHIPESVSEEKKMLHFQTTMALLWFFVLMINSPVLVHWWRYKLRPMEYDPSFYPAILIFLASAILWQDDVPASDRSGYNRLSAVVSSLSSLVMLYGLIDLYRTNYAIALAFVAMALHQLLSKKIASEPSEHHDQMKKSLDGEVRHEENTEMDNQEEESEKVKGKSESEEVHEITENEKLLDDTGSAVAREGRENVPLES